MKCQLLKELLETRYTVTRRDGYHIGRWDETNDYIGIGSSMCSDLIHLDCVTLKLTYALDTWKEGEKSLKAEELIEANQKLKELIANGQIHDIINGNDEGNTLEVYYEKDGEIIKKFCKERGWPNTTHDGYTMYENTHYPTAMEAAKESYPSEERREEILSDRDDYIQEAKERLNTMIKAKERYVRKFRKLKEYIGEE